MPDGLNVKRLAIVRPMVCDGLALPVGTVVDAVLIDPMTFAVFLRNGWFAVDAGYFFEVDSPDLFVCSRCGEAIDGACFDCADEGRGDAD
jgi:hypothetical protein